MEAPKTTCLQCGKEWHPDKWERHLSVCGVCLKLTIAYMEYQFQPVPRLRLEGK